MWFGEFLKADASTQTILMQRVPGPSIRLRTSITSSEIILDYHCFISSYYLYIITIIIIIGISITVAFRTWHHHYRFMYLVPHHCNVQNFKFQL
jgi:hypothetical protein